MTTGPLRVGRRPPVVLAILPRIIPLTLIGVIKPLGALHREGRIRFDVALESWAGRRRLARADVVVFSRNTEPRYAAFLDAALALGKPVIYELDDNFFEMPLGTPGSEYHRDPQRLSQLERVPAQRVPSARVFKDAASSRSPSVASAPERPVAESGCYVKLMGTTDPVTAAGGPLMLAIPR